MTPPARIPGDLAARARQLVDARNALFRRPDVDGAVKLCEFYGLPQSESADEAMALIHHWRLRWLEATDEMIAESEGYLAARPEIAAKFKGPPALTPHSRDIFRMASGKIPLQVKVVRR